MADDKLGSKVERAIVNQFGKKYGFSMESLDKAREEIIHAHAMLQRMEPSVHQGIHNSVLPLSENIPNPVMREFAEAGDCLYKMIGFMFAEKFGLDQYKLLEAETHAHCAATA